MRAWCVEGVAPLIATLALGCGTSSSNAFAPADLDAGGEDAPSFATDDGSTPFGGDGGSTGCKGLQCQQVQCGAGVTTSVSGKVYAPNGTLALYNVIAYVPNATPAPLPGGVSCDRCGVLVSGEPIASALTDATGSFRLENVPAGTSIPLVLQLGKWRRQVVIPEVKPCQETKLTDPNLLRLPKNRREGDMPRIAVTTGAADQIACMLPKIGVDPAEFGPGDTGTTYAVEFYNGAQLSGYPGQGPTGSKDATVLWNNLAKLKTYDIVVVSCEGYEASTQYAGSYPATWPRTQSPTSYAAMTQYLAEGGRIFTTDYEYTWYKYSPDANLKGAMVIPGGAPGGANPMDLDTSFAKGKALADWLKFVEPTSTFGKLRTDFVFNNISSSTSATQVWSRSGTPANPRFLTINTPVGKPVEQQCGKAVHLDAHINNTDRVTTTFPSECKSALKEGEKAFAFFFFDLAACIQKESEPPVPPVIK